MIPSSIKHWQNIGIPWLNIGYIGNVLANISQCKTNIGC